MTAASKNQGEAGFTLVELLVSLALLSLMMIYAINAFFYLASLNRAGDRADAQAEIQAVARHMREAIADMRPVFVNDTNGRSTLLFEGSHDSLQFVAASNGERETGGLYLVRYFRDEDGNFVAERRILREHDGGKPTVTTLLRRVEEIAFHYWGNTENGHETIADWQRTDALPTAIAVEIKFEDVTSQNKFDLIALPRNM